ncbi:CCR4-NOT transcription complex subunit 10 [Camellia lanceoleosa]|uniref:CCR4-NOT transcription complex subunit 10 n=1 Tax=Camellia lanceoleosa TaxID=1840588 RepID=A0ACC0IFL3_9ERIC|nr:CCR4-NOT transcription complex subunit 10 [Camellia lanceoleosa]
MIKQALLADLAYVELELGNPLKALSTARCLLELPECSRIYIFLGNVYAAESLCLLNRPKEAAEQLLIYLSGDNNVELPYSKEDCKQWRVIKNLDCEESNGGFSKNSSLDESQYVMFLNPEEAHGTLYATKLRFLLCRESSSRLIESSVCVSSFIVNTR